MGLTASATPDVTNSPARNRAANERSPPAERPRVLAIRPEMPAIRPVNTRYAPAAVPIIRPPMSGQYHAKGVSIMASLPVALESKLWCRPVRTDDAQVGRRVPRARCQEPYLKQNPKRQGCSRLALNEEGESLRFHNCGNYATIGTSLPLVRPPCDVRARIYGFLWSLLVKNSSLTAADLADMKERVPEVAELLRFMATPSRLLLLCQLSQGESTVGGLEEATGRRPPEIE